MVERILNEIEKAENRCVTRHNKLASAFIEAENAKKKNEQIAFAKELVSISYERANAYTNLIIAAGYVAFFSLWANVKNELSRLAIFSSGALITVSLLLFIAFELYKMIKTARAISSISEKLKNGSINGIEDIKRVEENNALDIARWWSFFLIPTVLTGISGGIVLLISFVLELLKFYPN